MTREEAVALLERYSNYEGLGIPNLAGCKEAMKVAVDALKEASPELAESEDERIRKALVWHLKADVDFVSNGVTKAECIAYLEKQKEQKHPNGCFTCDEYKKGYEEGRRNGFTAGYNKAMKEVEQKEQKPSGETNVEPDSKIPREEYLYHLLANHIITFTDYTYLLAKKPFDYECANIPQKDYTPVEQKSADLSEMMVHKEPYIAPVPTPMVADEQKQEWSEEEKEILDSILSHYVLIDKPIDANGISKEKYISLIKSIRFDTYKNCNSHWKPSEEQMEALYNVINPCDHVDKKALVSLYEQLKKLM